ncbi:hypothetical protein HBN50_03765 [Halobacteriovorax sp. GB3]|uniref:hypothetical protein n=1 Tax=Halobacteriovorax sp. GB3 TaxID=2719615 RepID=UPI00235E5CED|nr:hypothetical protein [Halobacteriovorax sp. GB3]MDD0852196.1 hypothetical protein [Halobacteriovorax sp. GB3]
MFDKEMLESFVCEIKDIRKEMVDSIDGLIQSKMANKIQFEVFGQLVDRIYGTAATLGFSEIASYTKSIKDVSYMASSSENERGCKKTLRMLIKYIELSDKICESIFDKEELKLINHTLNLEKSRVDLLNRREFFSVDKKSCDFS